MSWSSGFNDNYFTDLFELIFWIGVLILQWALILGIFVGIPVLVIIALVKYIAS